ncbi:MAG: hypothetical protein WC517_03400 [Patescibacteria group bacterium]
MVNRIDKILEKLAANEAWPERAPAATTVAAEPSAAAAPAAAPSGGMNVGMLPASALLLLSAMGLHSGFGKAVKATAPARLNTMARIKGMMNPSKLNHFEPWKQYLAQANAGFKDLPAKKKALEEVLDAAKKEGLSLSAFDLDNIGRELKATNEAIAGPVKNMGDKVLDFAGTNPWTTGALGAGALYGGTKAVNSIFGSKDNRAGNKTVIL